MSSFRVPIHPPRLDACFVSHDIIPPVVVSRRPVASATCRSPLRRERGSPVLQDIAFFGPINVPSTDASSRPSNIAWFAQGEEEGSKGSRNLVQGKQSS